MKAVNRDIAALIDETVRERFPDTAIDAVHVEEDLDYDGERVFRVQVIFDKKGLLDAHRTTTMARHLRHKLLERHEDAFPILAWVSKKDAAGMKPEAA